MQSENGVDQAKDRVLDAALGHVAFDGWSEVTLKAAIADSGVAVGLARALFPRGGVDLAVAYHQRGNAAMRAELALRDLGSLRYRDRIALAVRLRLEAISDPEAVRRGTAMFALPQHAAEGARLIWGTADAIWVAMGDSSTDINWYTKRITLSAVYGSTVLYWLGDDSAGHSATWEFLDRRIENVMAIEKLKSGVRDNAFVKAMMAGPLKGLEKLRGLRMPPDFRGDLPGGPPG